METLRGTSFVVVVNVILNMSISEIVLQRSSLEKVKPFKYLVGFRLG